MLSYAFIYYIVLIDSVDLYSHEKSNSNVYSELENLKNTSKLFK